MYQIYYSLENLSMTSNYWCNIWHLYIFNLYSIALQTITRMTLIVDIRVDCLEIILRRHVASIICNDNFDFYRTKKKVLQSSLLRHLYITEYWLLTELLLLDSLSHYFLLLNIYRQLNYIYIWHFNTEHWSLSITFYWPRNDIVIGIIDTYAGFYDDR